MAVVDRADREVVVLVGVPLSGCQVSVGRRRARGILTASRTACLVAMLAGGGRQGLDVMGATWWRVVVHLASVPCSCCLVGKSGLNRDTCGLLCNVEIGPCCLDGANVDRGRPLSFAL